MIPVDFLDQSDPLQKQSGMDAMFGDENAFSRFRVFRGVAAIRLREPVAAVALGAVIGQAFTVWRLLTSGTNAAAAMALAAIAVGLILELGFAGFSGSRSRKLKVILPATVALSVLCWFLPTLFRVALWSGYDLSEALIRKDGADFSAFLFRNMNTLAAIAAFSGFVAFWWRSLELSDLRSAPSRFVWIALGICSLLIHSTMTFPMAVTVTALLLLSLSCELLLRTSAMASPVNSAVNSQGTADSENGSEVFDWASKSNLSSSVGIKRNVSFVVCGAVIAAASAIFSMLVPFSLPLILLGALTASLLWRLLSIRIVARILSAERLQFSAMLLVAAFPLSSAALINLNFSLRTELDSAFTILLCQAIQFGMCLTSILLMSQCVRLLPSNLSPSESEPFSAQHLSLILLGAAAGFALLVYSVDAGVILGFGAACSAVLIISGQHWLPGRRIVAAAGACVVMLPTLLVSFDTERAGTILFSERSLEASRVGVNRDLIPQSDAGRLAERRMTALGEVQVWRRSGEVFEFRQNGRSLGYVSRDPEITPQPAEEIIPTILMMSMHSQPGRILILGDDTGVGLRVCSHFPVQRIVALRSSPEMTELAQRYTWNSAEVSPLTDERITIRHLVGPEALQSRPSVPFDVLMAAPSAADSPESLAYWSEEFFSAAKGQLSDNGVLCQRFHMRRLASLDLKKLMATALTSFQHVIVVQTARNEMALLATNATNGLPGRGVLKRLQQDYFRREIGTALRDWSQVATLPLLDARDAGGIFAHEAIPNSFSVADGYSAMSFPFRTLQHHDLSAELQAAFTPHQMTIAEVVPASEYHQEISRRQTALAQQLEILAAMPDEPWAYRKSLRTELQRNPRPPQDVVRSGEVERVMHPADQFRQDYFLTLGKSIQRVKSGDHSYEAFRGLLDYTVQYEPLLSLFAYYEIVRLHEVAQHPVPQEEFRHRLHTVFCTDQSDASIRPVVLAMKQLVEQPEVIADDAERFDLMNSLIQKLIERWEARTAWVPKSAKRVQDDVEYSVTLTNQALEKMSEWASAADYSESAMLNRRRYISAALTAPLRTYRDQVLAHMLRTEKAVQPVTDDDPDSEPLLIEQNALNTN